MRSLLSKITLALLLAAYCCVAGSTTHINDAGTWRQLQGVQVNDAGTWRTIREIYVNDSGTWRLVYASAQSFTMTGGSSFDGLSCNERGFEVSGALCGSYGSLAPSAVLGANSIQALKDSHNPGGASEFVQSTFCVSGFGANPGQNAVFANVVANSVTRTAAAASSYTYFSGVACWNWASPSFTGFGFSFTPGTNYAVTVNF